MQLKLYDVIKSLLVVNEKLRNSDKELIWTILTRQGLIHGESITYENFKRAEHPETIRRTRQMVQADFPELQSDKRWKELKDVKETSKGTYVYRESMFDYVQDKY